MDLGTWEKGATPSEWRDIDWQSDQRVSVAEENLGLVASWRDAWIPEVFICISKTFCTVHHYHSGEAISCDFWRWCRGLSSLVWHGNGKFAKKKHLFTNARYRWLVNMWTAYGGRKDLAAISLQRQTMRVDIKFVLTRPCRPTGAGPSRIMGQGYTQAGTFWGVLNFLNRNKQKRYKHTLFRH